MRLAVALLLSALSMPALAQPGGQPASTGQPASSGGGVTIQPVQPVQPPKPAGLPVPSGPVLSKQELEGGILAEDLKIGDGYEVKPGGAVVAFYHGTLKSDGTVFDSAFERGEPVAFALGQVIPGWQKGVPGMKVGGIRRLTIPAALAYGANPPTPKIPPNSDLVFVIQVQDAVQVEDLKPGDGEEAKGQCLCATAFTLKDKDGKVIDQTDAAHPYIWVPGEFQGVDAAVSGMKVGGSRRVKVPKEFNNYAGNPTPETQPVTLELQLIAVRNLPPHRRSEEKAGANGSTGATGGTAATGAHPTTAPSH